MLNRVVFLLVVFLPLNVFASSDFFEEPDTLEKTFVVKSSVSTTASTSGVSSDKGEVEDPEEGGLEVGRARNSEEEIPTRVLGEAKEKTRWGCLNSCGGCCTNFLGHHPEALQISRHPCRLILGTTLLTTLALTSTLLGLYWDEIMA